ncbi:hypothetical protein LJK88_14540 [Paenibacillus sp. P26]|nr:hypothetical protein LJK88_14540 [Paenibacillus sp. P26]
MSIPFQITDALSGVDHVEATLDGEATSLPITAKPYALSIGEHSIDLKAADHAGNITVQHIVLNVVMSRDYLDEALNAAKDRGFISNHGVLNSLLAKVNRIQQETDRAKIVNGLNALENEVSAQAGKQIEAAFAKHLLEDLAYLKNQASTQP